MRLRGKQLDAINAALKGGTAEDFHAALQKTCAQAEGVGQFVPAPGSASALKNPHIIVGEPRRCICGQYGPKAVGCRDVLASLAELVKHANIRGSGVSLYKNDILLINEVIQPLIVDCE